MRLTVALEAGVTGRSQAGTAAVLLRSSGGDVGHCGLRGCHIGRGSRQRSQGQEPPQWRQKASQRSWRQEAAGAQRAVEEAMRLRKAEAGRGVAQARAAASGEQQRCQPGALRWRCQPPLAAGSQAQPSLAAPQSPWQASHTLSVAKAQCFTRQVQRRHSAAQASQCAHAAPAGLDWRACHLVSEPGAWAAHLLYRIAATWLHQGPRLLVDRSPRPRSTPRPSRPRSCFCDTVTNDTTAGTTFNSSNLMLYLNQSVSATDPNSRYNLSLAAFKANPYYCPSECGPASSRAAHTARERLAERTRVWWSLSG
jgi:hypothetical protein